MTIAVLHPLHSGGAVASLGEGEGEGVTAGDGKGLTVASGTVATMARGSGAAIGAA